MIKTITIELTDELEAKLKAQAQKLNIPLAQFVLQQLIHVTETETTESDPVLSLIGSISLDVSDIAENHDRYIGEALHRELRGDE